MVNSLEEESSERVGIQLTKNCGTRQLCKGVFYPGEGMNSSLDICIQRFEVNTDSNGTILLWYHDHISAPLSGLVN